MMKKRWISALLCAALALGVLPGLAFAKGESRVTIGADLSVAQRDQVYADFNLKPGEVEEIIVTNADERRYLGGLVDEKRIGNIAISCVYIVVEEAGSGLDITTRNIHYCTADMYKNALLTAGITDASVMVSAPYSVSGTAALTGIYKAYEDITGQTLSDLAKAAGAEELVVTGELAELIGSQDATELIRQLKLILDETEKMTDEEVRGEIERLAREYNVEITPGQMKQLISLCRTLEKLDVHELQDRIVSLSETVQKANNFTNKVSEVTSNVAGAMKSFVDKIAGFFSNLFGGR